MNKVILMGRLVANPELKQTATDVNVATFTIAVNRRFVKEGQQQADFIRCTAWRQQADFICKYFPKGSIICVIGNIQTRSWDDSEGKKRYSTDVMVEEVYFTGEKRDSASQSDSSWDDFDTSGLVDECPF